MMQDPRNGKTNPDRIARCKAHYGDPSMTDADLLRARLSRLTPGYPASVAGLATDTGLSRERVAALLVEIGATRHDPPRNACAHTPARWSA
jgi:hypothetical protein